VVLAGAASTNAAVVEAALRATRIAIRFMPRILVSAWQRVNEPGG
jgi:hypothetical protein